MNLRHTFGRLSVYLLALTASLGLAQSVELNVWDLLTGGDGVRFQQLVDDFNEGQDRVNVNRTTLEWGTPFYTKVRTSTVAGQQPDVVTYHVSRLIDAVPGELLRPISEEELASVDLAKEDFNTSLVERATFDGQLYAVPLDTHPIVLYYNRDLLEQAGLLGEDGLPVIDGIEGFTEALRTVQETTGAFGVVAPNNWRVWYSMFVQQGGELISDDQVSVGEEGERALQMMADWVAEGLAPGDIDYAAGTAIFTGGQAAFMLNGVWEVPTLVDATESGSLPFDYGVTPVPQLFDNALTWADSTSLAIPNSQKAPITEAKLSAALEFIAYVQEHSLMWAGGGHIPAYTPVVESADYRSLEPNADYAAAGGNLAFEPNSAVAGAAGPTYTAAINFFDPAVNGRLPVDQAVTMFEQEVQSVLDNQGN